ncbi:MAG: hypothetical protein MAG431_02467 [Chloroflexi bacterium]|nr:hypothetical protein [Chloroflexota bacterium]
MRETLEQAQDLVFLPLLWVSTLPDPKSAQTVLNALKEIPPRERLFALLQERSSLSEVLEICTSVAERGGWEDKDKDALREAFQELLFSPDEDKVPEVLDVWSRPGLFGEQYLSALEAYYKAFFAEEEKRINSVLEKALNSAQLQARELAFPDLIKSLSRGVRLAIAQDVRDWVMVPSYWISPLVVYQRFDQEHGLFLFGGRPDEEALVPGDQVPDTMLRALKTLANPTRLKILRYLVQENMSPTELAQRLRLRAPTVTHHLKKLRLAGLVYLTLSEKKKKCYTTRAEAVENTFQALETFLGDK